MQTVSPNLARQIKASCTLAVASGENEKLRADIAIIFVQRKVLGRMAKENSLSMNCQELMPLEEDAIRRVCDDVPSCFGPDQQVPISSPKILLLL